MTRAMTKGGEDSGASRMGTALSPDPLAEGGIAGFARRLRRGKARAADLVATYLARIEAL